KIQRVQATVKDPRLFSRPLTTIVTAAYEKRQRESFTQRGVSSSFVLEIKSKDTLRHYLRYTAGVSEVFDLLVPESAFRELEPKLELGRLRLANVGYAIVFDGRDDPLNTTRGTYASADLRSYAKPLGSERRLAKVF